MSDLTARLIVQLIDQVSGPAKKAGQGMKGLAGELHQVENDLRKMSKKKIDLFNFSSSRKQLNQAKAELSQLVKERQIAWQKIRNFEGKSYGKNNPISAPLKKWRAEYAALDRKTQSTIRSVKSLSSAFDEQKNAALASARAANGLNFNHLINEEKKLRESVEWTNKVLGARNSGGASSGGPKSVFFKDKPRDTIPLKPQKPKKPSSGLSVKDGLAAGAGWSVWQAIRDSITIGFDFQKEANKAQSQGGVDQKTQYELEQWAKQEAIRTGYAAPQEIMGGTTDALKAGVPVGAVRPATKSALALAVSGDTSVAEALDGLVGTSSMFRLDTKTVDGATTTFKTLADSISLAANATRGTVTDVLAGLKMSGGFASLQGMTPNQTIAMLETMIQSGQTGAEAGTALRSMLVSGVKPTKDANQTMAELGMNMTDFATDRRDFTGDEATSGMQKRFGKGPKGMKERAQAKIDAMRDTSLGDISDELTDLFQNEYQSKTAHDKELIASAVQKFVSSQATEFDVIGMVEALQEKGVTTGQISRIFQAKHGVRLAALFRDKEFQKYLTQLDEQKPGSAEKNAELSQDNGVGVVNKTGNAAKTFAIDTTRAFLLLLQGAATGAAASYNSIPPLYNPLPQGNGFGPPPKSTRPMNGESSVMEEARRFQEEMNGPSVLVDTTAAQSSVVDLKAGLDQINSMTVGPTVATGGLDAAIAKLNQLLSLIGQASSSITGLNSATNNAHADINGGGGRGW